jgi:hypothetical protein
MSEEFITLYNPGDLDIINKNLNKIESDARMKYLKNYEPTLDEINSIYDVIKNYIRENNLIVYGGYAQNKLIEKKNKDDVFYEEHDIPDIEFYSPDPLKDLINLCDLLHSKNFKHVEGSEGVHPETYKIFVNFVNYTDFSYMPKNIFETCPTITLEGMRMTHPHFMIIDSMRVYVDPMTSYFRLNKTFSRFSRLSYYYPFNENSIYNKISYEIKIPLKQHSSILDFIVTKILKENKLIIVGHKAFNRLIRKAEMDEKYLIQEPFIQAISINLVEDRERIYKILREEYKDKITFKKYNPYFQFIDKSVEFYYGNQLIFRLYGNNERCIVYKYSEKNKLYYGTFQLIVLYLLSNYFLSVTRKNNFNKTIYMTMITRLLKAKNSYLDKHNINILSQSPFQEFVINCIGDPVDPLRQARLKMLKNKEKGKAYKFNYKPRGSPGKIPNYRFINRTGEYYK